MKNIRIIPRLDIKGPNVVKGIHSEGLRVVGNPKEMARRYYDEGADEILYMDIVASLYQRNLDFELLQSTAEALLIPLTVGGGIRSLGDINNALRAGADKVAINTYALHHPEFLREASKEFGSQCIVISIEAKKMGNGQWEAYTDGGREHSGIDAIEWAKKAIDMDVGEILITSIDADGTKKGYEIELIKKVTEFSPIPVIAHGGAGDIPSIEKVIKEGRADAVSASSIYHYRDYRILEVKRALNDAHINVRIV
ncbi:MAG: imidazole glycerol phosphate synthase subunit HisF [Candidatus Portnoybacteria bacterium]|nr:imidazole glycerol phosphate synthase subunit HisF [Candidatus Portnoybacteria bacterium]